MIKKKRVLINEKLLNFILSILFFVVFSFFYGNEYIDFHKEKNNEIIRVEEIKHSNDNFKLNQINDIQNIELYSTPNKNLHEEIIQLINNSKERVYIEVYMLTEKRIRQAIINAKNRNIDVKIILEKDPYLAYSINDDTYNELLNNNIYVVWSNKENYELNHTKLMIIDSSIIISTGNLTYSTFTQNKDLFLKINDENILQSLINIFEADFEGIKYNTKHPNIILSPENSRDKIKKLLLSAKEEIKIQIPYIYDEEIKNILIELNKKGINIKIIIAKTAVDDESIKQLIKEGLKIYEIPKYKLHSKSILIDNSILYIGSTNFSAYSLDKNREIGIITSNSGIIDSFNNIFLQDIIE